MSSAAFTEFELPVPPAAVTTAVQRVITDNKHHEGERNADGSEILFTTRKTMFNWEQHVLVQVSPTAAGSHVRLALDVDPSRPKALLDGKKNRKTAEKLAEQIAAAAGGS